MTQKQYRTAQGRLVDLGALQIQNENVRAVGNMPVNARGDLIDSQNRPIDTRNQQVARQYKKQVGNVQDSPVFASRHRNEVQQPPVQEAAPAPAPVVAEAPGGLAGAIARARSVTQEPLTPTGRTTGFKKI
jgi:predicted lipid-binding transport protein (Tim44 family)